MDISLEEKRENVVQAAFEVFTALGFARAQVTAIAELGHVSTATIYKMFDSKESLFRAAYEHGLKWLNARVLNDPSISDPVESLRHVARNYAATLNSPMSRRIVRMQIAQNTVPAGDGRTQGFSMRALVEGSFRDSLQKCVAHGLIEAADVAKAHALITGYIEHQTLIYGLIIDEDRVGPFSGPELADEAVKAALLAYAPATRARLLEPQRVRA